MVFQDIHRIVIDTDVLIYLMKKDLLDELIEQCELVITFITLYEYLRGLARIKEQRELSRIKNTLEKLFSIIWPTNTTIILLSEIWSKLSKKGMLIDDRDLFIGVLCIENNLPLWTFNKKHFRRLEEFGLKLVDLLED